jgi:hypothetical protein
MVGDDHENWDVCVTIPKEVFVEVLEVLRARSGLRAEGVGAVPPDEAASAMAEGYRDWVGSAG